MRYELYPAEMKRLTEVTLPQAGVNDVRIRADERIYATAGWDHRYSHSVTSPLLAYTYVLSVRVFSWKKNTPLAVLRFHTAAVNCVAFQEQSNLLAAASADGRVAVWSIY